MFSIVKTLKKTSSFLFIEFRTVLGTWDFVLGTKFWNQAVGFRKSLGCTKASLYIVHCLSWFIIVYDCFLFDRNQVHTGSNWQAPWSSRPWSIFMFGPWSVRFLVVLGSFGTVPGGFPSLPDPLSLWPSYKKRHKEKARNNYA